MTTPPPYWLAGPPPPAVRDGRAEVDGAPVGPRPADEVAVPQQNSGSSAVGEPGPPAAGGAPLPARHRPPDTTALPSRKRAPAREIPPPCEIPPFHEGPLPPGPPSYPAFALFQPVTPVEPAAPSPPAHPAAQTQPPAPIQPPAPPQPVTPNRATPPAEMVTAAETVTPAHPVAPVAPVAPHRPDRPARPGTSTREFRPVRPIDPTRPVAAGSPITPTSPAPPSTPSTASSTHAPADSAAGPAAPPRHDPPRRGRPMPPAGPQRADRRRAPDPGVAIGAAGLDTRLVGRVPPGDSTLRRIGHSALRLFTSNAAVRELAELAAAVQAPVTTGRRIAVVSVRGGAGRTATTALLGTVFAARRADHVLVADGDPEHGSLAWRLGLPGAGGLAPPLLAARALAEVDLVLPRTAAGLRLLPGGPTGEVRAVSRAVSRFFAICVTDCGRGLTAPGTLEVLHETHAVVVAVPLTPDGVRSTCAELDRLPAAALAYISVALNTIDPIGRATLDRSAATAALARYGVPVVWLPRDRHLAAGAPIVPARLGESITVAATRLAGHALERACRF